MTNSFGHVLGFCSHRIHAKFAVLATEVSSSCCFAPSLLQIGSNVCASVMRVTHFDEDHAVAKAHFVGSKEDLEEHLRAPGMMNGLNAQIDIVDHASYVPSVPSLLANCDSSTDDEEKDMKPAAKKSDEQIEIVIDDDEAGEDVEEQDDASVEVSQKSNKRKSIEKNVTKSKEKAKKVKKETVGTPSQGTRSRLTREASGGKKDASSKKKSPPDKKTVSKVASFVKDKDEQNDSGVGLTNDPFRRKIQ